MIRRPRDRLCMLWAAMLAIVLAAGLSSSSFALVSLSPTVRETDLPAPPIFSTPPCETQTQRFRAGPPACAALIRRHHLALSGGAAVSVAC